MVNGIDFLKEANAFKLSAPAMQDAPLGNGHINVTRLITGADGKKYVLQRINDRVFTNVKLLMQNIVRVTEYLNRRKPGSSLHFLKTADGEDYLHDESGYFRLYEYAEGISLEKASCAAELKTCGTAFGGFQQTLKDFDASLLGETIPRFHDTVKRVRDLESAAEKDVCGRLRSVKPEYDFYISRKQEAGRMLDLLAQDKLKLRVTHNDTKLNNVILDPVTLSPVCVIDLDTVMPGLTGNDFGDCIRSGASTAAEDEKDVSKVSLDLELYRAFAGGFLGSCKEALTETEIRTLPWGAYLMTYECGARFLTDYLSGDTYFHTAYAEHNLVRARTQMKLVADTEDKMNEIERIITQEAEA